MSCMNEVELPFPVGTTVWLKSGGPAMTISDYDPQSLTWVSVEWFELLKLHREAFHKDCLTTIRPNADHV